MNAVAPYLNDYMAKYGRYFEIKPLTHGNQRKYDRVQWALQGRAQKGLIHLVKDKEGEAPWNEKLVDQAISFPSKYVHDDLVDALAYIDQMAPEAMGNFDIGMIEKATMFHALDTTAGY